METPFVIRGASGVPARDVRGIERALAALAGRQDGVASRAQLLALGLTADEIRGRVRAGRLIRIHRGVYAVGHAALTGRGRARAALLAAGPQAVASHHTAAALWSLTAHMPAVQDVTLLRGDRRSRKGLRIHHTSHPIETRTLRGLTLTSPARTLADLGHPDVLTREALARRLVHPEDLPADAAAPTRAALERRMLSLIRDAALPAPLVNHPVGPYVCDFVWPAQRVIVETDGWATHGRRAAFEDDRARDAALQAAGWSVLRFTWRQVAEAPLRVAAQVAAVLARG